MPQSIDPPRPVKFRRSHDDGGQAPATIGGGIPCPNCGSRRNDVKDSRPTASGTIRRRRRCATCDSRFTTHEIADVTASRMHELSMIDNQLKTLGGKSYELIRAMIRHLSREGLD